MFQHLLRFLRFNWIPWLHNNIDTSDEFQVRLALFPAVPRFRVGVSAAFVLDNKGKGIQCFKGILAAPPKATFTPRNKGLIAGLIKGNQWLISPDHKALFLGGS